MSEGEPGELSLRQVRSSQVESGQAMCILGLSVCMC
jgi:hypothetical protein